MEKIETNGYWVYTHTTPDGMVYVGMSGFDSTNLRWVKGHYKPHTTFGKAIKEWGWDNIEHRMITDGLSKEDALLLEAELIDFCKRNQCSLNEHRSGGWRKDKDKVKVYNAKRWARYKDNITYNKLGYIPLW